MRYRNEPFKTEKGWHYRILEGDRVVLQSGGFLDERCAIAAGDRFAADDDLEALINRK